MGRTNFAECSVRYTPLNESLIPHFGYDGPLEGITRNRSTQITLAGCRALCGTGIDWYPWAQASGTLLTWVLPVVGILVQAPFVSNAFWETVFSLARWVGNPMASLSYNLWNIKVSGRAAMMVDMSVPYDCKNLAEHSDFGSIRDSFYLLNTMNQFAMRPDVRQKKEAEGLLRIVLFSKDIHLLKRSVERAEPTLIDDLQSSNDHRGFTQIEGTKAPTVDATCVKSLDLESKGYLNARRQKLARDMREARIRGVVPIYITIGWFLFCLALSLQYAFGIMGRNEEAHDLALGCLLAWLPVLVLCSTVDRNPIATDNVQKELNDLVDRVRTSLMNKTVRKLYLDSIHDRVHQDNMRAWVQKISDTSPELDEFFEDFAGQGRTRWHYGCCHPITRDIERAFIAGEGRDWLHSEQEARTFLVLGDVTGGLDWFDNREFWQVAAAIAIVGGSITGAFILSYFTPTVGLGCRSGGYIIFGIISLILLVLEIGIWWIVAARKPWLERFKLSRLYLLAVRALDTFGQTLRSMAAVLPRTPTKLANSCLQVCLAPVRKWQGLETQKKLKYLDRTLFKPAEVINAAWLVYITMAQTFGAYRTCECMTSAWGGKNYMDFKQYTTSTSTFVKVSWISGASTSISIMVISMIYVFTQWCIQSHLSSADAWKASRGLQRTRRFRRMISPIWVIGRFTGTWLAKVLMFWRLGKSRPKSRGKAKTLRWSKAITCENAHHDHPKPAARSVQNHGTVWTPWVSVQDAEDRPLVRDTGSYELRAQPSTAITPRSSFEMPQLHMPIPSSSLQEFQLTYERRSSNEHNNAAPVATGSGN